MNEDEGAAKIKRNVSLVNEPTLMVWKMSLIGSPATRVTCLGCKQKMGYEVANLYVSMR